MIHVALVCEFENLNGAERSLLAAVDRLSGREVRYSVVCPPSGLLTDAFSRRHIPVYALEWKDTFGKTISMEERRTRFANLMSSLQANPDTTVDLVHANSLSSARMTGPVCQRLNLPSIGHIRDIIRLGRQVIADINAHTAVLCVSQATLAYHRAQGLDAAKSFVAYNGIDTNVFYPQWKPLEQKKSGAIDLPKRDYLRVGMAGQISLRKGMDVLLEAIEQLANRRIAQTVSPSERVPLLFEIAGSRQSEKEETALLDERIRAIADQINQNQGNHQIQVLFIGQRDSLSDWLRSLDVYVHAARQEPLGRVLLEAAVSGTPVVATNVGGTGEIFPPQETPELGPNALKEIALKGAENRYGAILVPPNDPETLANALSVLLTDDHAADRRATMAYQAWRQGVERFTDEQAAQSILHFYTTICKKSG